MSKLKLHQNRKKVVSVTLTVVAVGLSFPETADLLSFSDITISRVYRVVQKKRI